MDDWHEWNDMEENAMNQWMSEWTDEWTNEWKNEWMIEWMNEWISEWVNEWMNERMNERSQEQRPLHLHGLNEYQYMRHSVQIYHPSTTPMALIPFHCSSRGDADSSPRHCNWWHGRRGSNFSRPGWLNQSFHPNRTRVLRWQEPGNLICIDCNFNKRIGLMRTYWNHNDH
jgi:hypothetical protein